MTHCRPPHAGSVLGAALPAFALLATVALLGARDASAVTLAGVEIDADQSSAADALYAQSADDWAETGSSAANGVFLLSAGGVPTFSICYGSDIGVNPAIDGTAGFICDGSSDSRFDGNGGDAVVQPEKNIVAPGGKQIDDIWHIREGGVTAKDDFSHAYYLFRTSDSSCDSDTEANNPFLMLGGHRGDNEGDAFWGFELDQVPPTRFGDVASNAGGTLDMDFSRTPGDLLISFTLVGGGTNPLLEVFSWDGSTFAPAPSLCPGGSQGDSLLRTNASNDIQAPPWNVPVCDPTSMNGTNNCRIVNENGTAPAAPGDNLIGPRDFSEAVVDIGAFVAGNVCYNSLLFTSRSAHPLETADLKDVGGIALNTCPAPAAPPPPAPPEPTTPPGPQPPVALPPTGAEPSHETPWWLFAANALSGVLILAGAASCAAGKGWRRFNRR